MCLVCSECSLNPCVGLFVGMFCRFFSNLYNQGTNATSHIVGFALVCRSFLDGIERVCYNYDLYKSLQY